MKFGEIVRGIRDVVSPPPTADTYIAARKNLENFRKESGRIPAPPVGGPMETSTPTPTPIPARTPEGVGAKSESILQPVSATRNGSSGKA